MPSILWLNQADAPWALPQGATDEFFRQLRPKARYPMPFDELMPALANLGRFIAVERPQAPWVGALRPLLGRVLALE